MPRGSQAYRHEVISPWRPSGGALTAAARVYESGPGATKLRNPGERTRTKSWQIPLWDAYDAVPEFHSACNWVGNLVSKAVLEVHYDGKPTTEQAALDALESLFGGREGQEEMLRLFGINFTVAGEAFAIGRPGRNGEDDDWQVAAAVEVNEEQNPVTVEGVSLPDGSLSTRLWRRHPRKSYEADCPARALLPTLTQIIKLTQVIDAQADSRLKGNGILFVPSELELPAVPVTVENEGDETVSMQQLDQSTIAAGLTRLIIDTMKIAIRDRDSAAAGAPIVVAAPGEYLEKVNWVDFWTGFDEHVKELRREAVERIGIGMDMPPEALTGTGDMNHWGAWQIEEAAIKVHTEPLLNIIVSSLTTGYLRPYLEASGVADVEKYTFEANTASMRLQPNRSKEAVELYDRGVLNERRLLIENGFDPETDAPDEQERIMHFLVQVASKTGATPDQLAAVLDRLGIKGIPGDDAQDTQGALEPRSTLREHPVRAIPAREDSESDDARAIAASGAIESRLMVAPLAIDGLVLAAEQMVYRALERAGNRLRNQHRASSGDYSFGLTSAQVAQHAAADLYLRVSPMSFARCEELLTDAWGLAARFTYPGVNPEALQDALHEYTLMLLRSQRPLARDSLARHLMIELAEDAA